MVKRRQQRGKPSGTGAWREMEATMRGRRKRMQGGEAIGRKWLPGLGCTLGAHRPGDVRKAKGGG